MRWSACPCPDPKVFRAHSRKGNLLKSVSQTLSNTNDPSRGRSGAGSSCPRVAVDDFSRVAYAGLLPDERRGTCSAFMARCLALFAGLGVRAERVMTDNGPG